MSVWACRAWKRLTQRSRRSEKVTKGILGLSEPYHFEFCRILKTFVTFATFV